MSRTVTRCRPLRSVALVVLGAFVLCGCRAPTKTLVIESDPPGATIWVNGQLYEKTTPVRVPFEWYGRWEVRLELRGYESVATELEVPTELNGYPIIDLFALPFAGDQSWTRRITMRPIGTQDVESTILDVRRRAEAMEERTRRALREPGTPTPEAPRGR